MASRRARPDCGDARDALVVRQYRHSVGRSARRRPSEVPFRQSPRRIAQCRQGAYHSDVRRADKCKGCLPESRCLPHLQIRAACQLAGAPRHHRVRFSRSQHHIYGRFRRRHRRQQRRQHPAGILLHILDRTATRLAENIGTCAGGTRSRATAGHDRGRA
jgi:hypothetical protein